MTEADFRVIVGREERHKLHHFARHLLSMLVEVDDVSVCERIADDADDVIGRVLSDRVGGLMLERM